jgi:hypothetical protein
MSELLLFVIFLSIIILGSYLNYPIENMKNKLTNSEKTKIKINNHIERIKANKDFIKLNDECSSKGVQDEKCRDKYFKFCNSNADNNICTLYDMKNQTIIPRMCNSFKDNVSDIDTWNESLEAHKKEIKNSCCSGYYYKNPIKNAKGITKNEPINPENKSLYVIGGYDEKTNSGIRYSSPFGPNESCNNNNTNNNDNRNDCIGKSENQCSKPSCQWHIDGNYTGCCVSRNFKINNITPCPSDGTSTLPDY